MRHAFASFIVAGFALCVYFTGGASLIIACGPDAFNNAKCEAFAGDWYVASLNTLRLIADKE